MDTISNDAVSAPTAGWGVKRTVAQNSTKQPPTTTAEKTSSKVEGDTPSTSSPTQEAKSTQASSLKDTTLTKPAPQEDRSNTSEGPKTAFNSTSCPNTSLSTSALATVTPSEVNTPAPSEANTPAPSEANTPAPSETNTSVPTFTLTHSDQTFSLVTSKDNTTLQNATTANNTTTPVSVAGEATSNVTASAAGSSANATVLLPNSSSTAIPMVALIPANATNESNTSEVVTPRPETSASVSPGKVSQSSSTTLQPADHCAKTTCPPYSKCQNLYLSFTCICPPGLAFSLNDSCLPARIFPGTLHLKNKKFSEAMKQKNSKEFHSLANKIQNLMKNIFADEPNYLKSIVRKLEKGSVEVHLDTLFGLASKVTEDSIHRKINNFIKNCTDCGPLSIGDTYSGESICHRNYCDINTTKCKNKDGLVSCDCLPGYYKFTPSDRSCKACTSGFKLVNGICVKCPFGYRGFNCNESFLLAVVVISCVLGCLLLLFILIAACLWCKKSTSNSSCGSQDYVMWPKADVPKIPRVTMNWESHQLEMQENGSTNSLTDSGRTAEKTEGLKTFKGKQPSRYTYLCQGQENPYYISDEKKSEYL
eukprot:gi/632967049/ref/XP_007899757.1/ PREDICTED: mucin-13 [Callorhinchus milii]